MRLFIAEKPSLARAIADGLGGGQRKDGYLDCASGDVVTWCFGHLLELAAPEEYNRAWKQWSKETLPLLPQRWRKEPRRDKGVDKQLKVIARLLQRCASVVNAGDPDREGQLIVDEVLEYLSYSGSCQRIWLAALDGKSVAKALSGLEDNAGYKHLKVSAEARARADWLYGLNTTRALTLAAQSIGIDGVLSGGRVQTATLNLIGKRSKEIENFRPRNYWTLHAHILHDNGGFMVTWTPEEGPLTDKELADRIARAVHGQPGAIAGITTEEKQKAAPPPHCLSSLQAQANAAFGYSAKETLDAAQQLYEGKYISYPRSDCRFLPEEQFSEAGAILAALRAYMPACANADATIKSRAWNTAKVTAHHAIIPTGVAPQTPLEENQANIYSLVCLGYARQFFPPLRYEAQHILVELPSESGAKAPARIWKAAGRRILDAGWTVMENDEEEAPDEERQAFPDMREGDPCTCERGEARAKKTKAPPRFTEGTLISAMANVHKFIDDAEAKKILRENEGIGTEATRAGVLETLKSRGYICIRKNKIYITALGQNALDLSPDALKDPVTTAIWERQLKDIAEGRLYLDRFLHAQEKAIPDILEGIFSADLASFKVDVHKCPACGFALKRMADKKDKRKHYWACFNSEQHEDGNPLFLPDANGKPGELRKRETSACPECGKALYRVESRKKGTFYWRCENRQCPLLSDDNGRPGKPFGRKQ